MGIDLRLMKPMPTGPNTSTHQVPPIDRLKRKPAKPMPGKITAGQQANALGDRFRSKQSGLSVSGVY